MEAIPAKIQVRTLSVDARLRQVLCMGPSDHTQVPTPGAYVYPGLPPRSLTPDLAVRGRFPHAQWDLVADWAARQHPPITPTGTAAAKMQQPHHPRKDARAVRVLPGPAAKMQPILFLAKLLRIRRYQLGP